MKTAVILSGDPRTYTDCFPSLRSNILSTNDCDVFPVKTTVVSNKYDLKAVLG